MNPIITSHQEAVARLEVFGSAAEGDFDEQRSDLDFLVEFGEVPPGDRFDTFFGLQRALGNPYFIRRMNETRRLVYAA